MATLFVDKIDPQSGTSLEIGSSGDTISKGSGVVSRLGVFESQLLHVRDEKASGTNAGTFTAGAWITRTLNTIKTNEITGASLSSNQITLPTGTYYINASAPGYDLDRHQTALYNITDSSFEIIGTSEYSNSTDLVQTRSFVLGRFTISAQKTFELQHRGETSKTTFGLGVGSNFGQINTFADVQIWRTA
jgi:hypothetical protein